MKKLVMLLALAVAFSLSGFAQTGSTSGSTSGGTSSSDTGKTSSKKSSKKAASSDMASSESGAKAGGKTSLTGCLKSDSTPYMITNKNNPNGVTLDSSDDLKAHNGHKVKAMGSWEGTGADKKFKATSVKHVSETCSADASGSKASATSGESKGKKGKKGAAETKTPS